MNELYVRLQRKNESGQSLVEFVLVSILVALLLAGLVDLGRAYFTKIAITDAAGEGAIYASIKPSCLTPANCAAPNNVEDRVKNSSAETGMVNPANVHVITSYTNPSPGQLVSVTVSYDFQLITPFVSTIVGSDILVIRALATQVIQ
ncbi:MAG: pilus assembly protein [Thermoflexales bacterium]|nr:pilus assembly protein [Thermoflexales bacterium]